MHIYSGISSLAVTIFRLKTLRIAKPSDTFYFLLRYTASFMYLLFNSGGLATQPQFHPGCDHQGDLHHEPQLSQGPLLHCHAGGLQQDYHVGPPPSTFPCIDIPLPKGMLFWPAGSHALTDGCPVFSSSVVKLPVDHISNQSGTRFI
jgi:hypothetical protein